MGIKENDEESSDSDDKEQKPDGSGQAKSEIEFDGGMFEKE